MEEIINSVMQSPENTNPNVLRGQLQKIGDSGGGVLMVTDNDGTLDKTMGEIQDAYLAGKRVIINHSDWTNDIIGIAPIIFTKRMYVGAVITLQSTFVSDRNVFAPLRYYAPGETEEAARNAYPVSVS